MDLPPPPPPLPQPTVGLRIIFDPAGECTGCQLSLDGRPLSELAAEEAAAAERAQARARELNNDGSRTLTNQHLDE